MAVYVLVFLFRRLAICRWRDFSLHLRRIAFLPLAFIATLRGWESVLYGVCPRCGVLPHVHVPLLHAVAPRLAGLSLVYSESADANSTRTCAFW